MKIESTKDYKQFKKVRGNRHINKSHLRQLMNSIEENNLLAVNPIIVNNSMEIIDGQHRLEAAKQLKLDIFYVVTNTKKDDIIRLNSNSRQWSTIDYVNFYIAQGSEDYKTLLAFSQEFELSLSVSMLLLCGMGGRKGHYIASLKDGSLRIKSEEEARVTAQKLNDMKPFVEGNIWKDREFIRAVMIAGKKTEHQELLDQLGKMHRKIATRGNTRDYLRDLEEAFNYRKVNEVRFF